MNDSFNYIGNYICKESIRNLNRHLSESEQKMFSNTDYYYLAAIYHMDKPNLSQVAEELGLTRPAISALVKKLSRLELVEKIQSEEDKRIYHLNVTEKGKKIAEGDEIIYQKISSLIMSLLDNEEQYRFVEGLLSQIADKLKHI